MGIEELPSCWICLEDAQIRDAQSQAKLKDQRLGPHKLGIEDSPSCWI
uniref:Uncharacterized protein n=1 Tax=Arundo donax TaxID=35708 RepID=A0A0A9BAN9_ARUDO